ncbi:MAG: hypothetical protein K8R60_00525 [Burkholderiales bacterium]|nr:hypothetical protein [Burkholderiales bacterium]
MVKPRPATRGAPKFAVRWSVALTALLVGALTGGVVLRIVTMRGPSWFFYAISAGVLALLAIDAWDKLRDARARSRAAACAGAGTSPLLGANRSSGCRNTDRACGKPAGYLSCPYLLD